MTTSNHDNTGSTPTPTPKEPSMEEYAAMRMAEMSGQAKPQQAAAAVSAPPAAATDDPDFEDPPAAATDDEDDGGKTPTASATEDGEANEDQPKQGKKGLNKRFSELTAEKKAALAAAEKAKAEAEAARREAEQARAETERLRLEAERAANAIPKVPSADDDPVPDKAYFDDPDEYARAMAAHAARAEVRKAAQLAKEEAEARAAEARERLETAKREQVAKAVNELNTSFLRKVEEAKPDYPDYDEKVVNNDQLVVNNNVFFTIQQAADAPHLLYHLASNPEIAQELNRLDPVSAAMRVGELQAELRLERKKPKVSKASEPVRPVGARSSPLQKSPDEMSPEEYAQYRTQQANAAGRNSRVRII